MNKVYLKSNKGVTVTDVVIAVLLMTLFVGVLSSLYTGIVTRSVETKLNSIATYNLIKIAEYIDKISYEEVQNSLNDIIKDECEISSDMTVNIEVENYNSQDNTKEDIIKIVKIQIDYQTLDSNTINYGIKKLKIKEM